MDINVLHRKERLIITTIEIIDELGIQRLTTREIARRQDISEATLFRHFKNKNELLLAVLDYFAQFDQDIFKSIRLKKLMPIEAIYFFISTYAEYYESYPAIASIIHLFDVLRYEDDLKEKVNSILFRRTHFIRQLIKKAQKAGEICFDAESEHLVDIIMGLCLEICLRWKLERRRFSLRERTRSILKMLLDAYSV